MKWDQLPKNVQEELDNSMGDFPEDIKIEILMVHHHG